MKILNLFAGIGGNRTLWGDEHEITAIEHDKDIAKIYMKRFPNDEVLIGDAYGYLESQYKRFDFIWASPPCTTHTQLCRFHKNKRLPDMRLYSIIVFLKTWSNKFWSVENVLPYYHALIKPTAKVGRHLIWANFSIKNLPYNGREIRTGLKMGNSNTFKKKRGELKPQETNDKMNPLYGKHILDSINTKTLESFL